ncbi:MAG: aminoacyl-tRNA deacylase [Candidatus Competibacteraceae bacterium]|nr:aminoacyl-tRNA deacylase [Candidatus Competibacteraceae bacterium]
MSQEKFPITPAIRFLRIHSIAFTPHLYPYQEQGGTDHSARCLGVDEHDVIKTLIMEDDLKKPLIVLMHGDRQVSTQALARQLQVRSIAPCNPTVAQKHSGYQIGGTSPFGARKTMPVCLESSILDLPRIYINGGKRGFLIGMTPADLQRLLQPTLVQVATGA